MTIRTVPPDVRRIEDFRFESNLTDGQPQRLGLHAESSKSGVTIHPASHPASAVNRRFGSVESAQDILASLEEKERGEIIQSCFPDGAPEGFVTSSNGFVHTAIRAYSTHHHLRIRPEDIWLAIITQLSSYINAHSEELRGSFVSHQGKKELEIVYSSGTRYTVDWAEFAENIGRMIQDNVVDPELRQWVLPAFSTTTEHDVAVASIVMMASMQSYFEYSCSITCGLPSVTLLGQKEDYELILQRLDKLRSYGKEPTQFADLLTPVVKRFIWSFDDPKGEETVDFWNRIFTSWNMGSGSDYYSGWITAFIFWDKDGKIIRNRDYLDEHLPALSLDGVTYHRISEDDVPPGFCTVPVNIDDNGVKIKAEMLAGSVGMESSSSGEEMADGKVGLDTFQPRSGWWIYEQAEEKAEEPLSASMEEWRVKLQGIVAANTARNTGGTTA